MREGVEVRLRPGDWERLEAVISDRRSPQHHVWRARIVLMTAAGAGTMTIRSVTGKGEPTIWRWASPATLPTTTDADGADAKSPAPNQAEKNRGAGLPSAAGRTGLGIAH
jgi:hypothetical protein